MYRFIWKIEIKDPAQAEQFIKNWHEASKVLQEYPGAKGTKLHKDIDNPSVYVAIAEWESKEARDAMQADVKASDSERAKRWNKFSKNDSFGQVIPVARLEEIDSV